MMSPRAPALVLGLAIAGSTSAGATVIRQPALAELVASAQRIVITEVVELRTGQGRDRDVPITLVTLRVLETLKGAAALQVVLEFPGGRSDTMSLEVAGTPGLAPGDRDVLFLHGAGQWLSPIVGVFAGRFRIVRDAASGKDVVRPHDGAPAGEPVPLAEFRRAVLLLLADDAPAARASTAVATAPVVVAQAAAAVPDCLRVELGGAPALLNGCPDWRCAVQVSLAAAGPVFAEGRAPVISDGEADPEACPASATIAWTDGPFGRLIDEFTLAVTVHEESAATRRTSILLNRGHSWNAYAQAGRDPADPRLDVVRVLAEELASWARVAAGGGLRGAATTRPGSRPRIPGRGEDRSTARAAVGACDAGSDAILNPRLLIFDSPDYALMSGYEVGFFLPGAGDPVTVVNLPLSAFLERRFVDLPADAVAALEATLVVSIASAGLATPLGQRYAYRVRGLWPGGRTVWSGPSPVVARCPR